jgi:hypothetical protein
LPLAGIWAYHADHTRNILEDDATKKLPEQLGGFQKYKTFFYHDGHEVISS